MHAHTPILLSVPKKIVPEVRATGRSPGEVEGGERFIFPAEGERTAGVRGRRICRSPAHHATPELSTAVCLPAHCLLGQYISGDARHLDRRAPGI